MSREFSTLFPMVNAENFLVTMSSSRRSELPSSITIAAMISGGLTDHPLLNSLLSGHYIVYENGTIWFDDIAEIVIPLLYNASVINWTIIDGNVVFPDAPTPSPTPVIPECVYPIGSWITLDPVPECGSYAVGWCGFTHEDVRHFFLAARGGKISADSHLLTDVVRGGQPLKTGLGVRVRMRTRIRIRTRDKVRSRGTIRIRIRIRIRNRNRIRI